MPKIPFYVPYGYDEEQAYDSKEGLVEELLDASQKNDEKEFADIDALSGSISSNLVASAAYDSGLNSILFYNANGEAISTVSMSDIIVSGLITEAYYDKDAKKIIIKFDNGDEVDIDVADIVDINEAGDGLITEDGKIKIKIDETSENFVSVSEDGLKIEGVNAAISGAIEEETARAESAESGLQASIDAEVTRAQGQEATLSSLISTETSRATGAENTIQTALSQEVSRAQGAEGVLQIGLTNEINRAQSEEQILTNKIEAEEFRATNAENALDTKIDNEIARATGVENGLQDSIAAEENRAKAAESGLQASIDAEVTRAQGVEGAISGAVSSNTQNIDTLSGQVSGVQADLQAEVTRAESAESGLQSAITAETSRAEAAESGLQADITAEETRATGQENAISGKVDSVVSSVTYDSTANTITFSNYKGENVAVIDANDFIGPLDYQDSAVTGQYVSEVSEENGVISVERADVSKATLNDYESIYDNAEFSAITEDEADVITSGDTINQAFNKVEGIITKDERVTAAALIDLNERLSSATTSIEEVSAEVSAEATRAQGVEGAISGNVNTVSGKVNTLTTNLETVSGNVNTVSGNVNTLSSNVNTVSGNVNTLSGTMNTLVSGAEYDSSAKTITLYNLTGGTASTIDTSDFVVEGMIESVTLEEKSGTTYLVIEWNTSTGTTTTELNIGDIFEADNYYDKAEIDSALSEISDAFEALDYTDSPAEGQYVSGVSEINGVISVSRGNVGDAVLNGYESLFDSAEYSGATANEQNKIQATDTIKQAFNKIEAMLADNELVISQALNDLAARVKALEDA